LARPVVMELYVQRHYHIDKKMKIEGEPIKQKWNGLAQHIAAMVLNNTDIAVLTIFSSLQNVSIYSVYYMVAKGVKQMIDAMTTGVQAAFGNMLAKNEMEILNAFFDEVEFLMHSVTSFSFACTFVLIGPFVMVYTKGITDANYSAPIFAAVFVLAQAAYCIRLPYSMMILAAGHYKQTQNSAVIEALLNIFVSVALVIRFGLVGVAVGTLLAMVYRTTYFALYLDKNVLFHSKWKVLKNLLADAVCFCITVLIASLFELTELSYMAWLVLAIKVALVAAVTMVVVRFIFYKQMLLSFIGKKK
jgi:O-antigen/teichoic acid export membrane protein